MRIISFKNSQSVDLNALEEMSGFSFPQQYKEFLSEYNGGLVDQDEPLELGVLGTEYTVSLSVLFGMNTDISDFDICFINSLYEDDIPENAMVIGATDDGGLIFVLFAENDFVVCYWDRNLVLNCSSEEENAYVLFGSYSEFADIIGDIELSDNEINIIDEEGETEMIEKVDYLPLGSVVYLRGATGKLMITSRALIVKNGDKEVFFEYAGVPFPEGLVSDKLVYFNHDGIAKVVYEGFRDEEDEIVIGNIHAYIEENPDLEKGDVSTWVN